MPEHDIGPVVTTNDIEIAALDWLKEAVPFYLARLDEQDGQAPGTTVAPRSYEVRSTNERWAEETPPALVVESVGTVGDPERHGNHGSYAAVWQLNIGVTVGGATEDGTRALANRHAAAIRLVVTQRRTLNGLAEDVLWKGEGPGAIVAPQRTLMACEVIAHVLIRRAVDTRGLAPRGIPDPPTDPAPPTPTPTGVRVRVRDRERP